MQLRRGNTYNLKVKLTEEDGSPIDFGLVELVEFTFGSVKKTYDGQNREVEYDTTDSTFVVKFTQEDTFTFKSAEIEYQARVKYVAGAVRATKIGVVDVLAVLSREVL